MDSSERYRRIAGREASPSALPEAKREWRSVLQCVNVLLRRTEAPRVPVVCTDGMTIFLLRGSSKTEYESLTVRLLRPDPPADSWGALSPAPETYRNVPAADADIVELIWAHGGVDMPASRARLQEAQGEDA